MQYFTTNSNNSNSNNIQIITSLKGQDTWDAIL